MHFDINKSLNFIYDCRKLPFYLSHMLLKIITIKTQDFEQSVLVQSRLNVQVQWTFDQVCKSLLGSIRQSPKQVI